MLLRIFSRMSRTRHPWRTTKVNKHGSEQGLIPPRAKGLFVSVASIRKGLLSSMCCKIINASREKTSSTNVHEGKPGEREREDAEITWEDGRQVVELGVLVKGLEAYSVCKEPLQLKNIAEEKRYGLASLLYVQCKCSNINTVYTGKSHRPSSSHHGLLRTSGTPVFYICN